MCRGSRWDPALRGVAQQAREQGHPMLIQSVDDEEIDSRGFVAREQGCEID